MRTVIYARYSSALQNSRSIEDQIAICRERADREGWTVVNVFTDYAISGAAGISETNRPGLNAMLVAVAAGGVDQVLAEATDRIARHQGDSFTIRERLNYAGARLFTLSDGEITEINGTFKGLMDAQFRKELGAKVKRGQRGTVADKRSPAGLAYGYRTANRLDARGQIVRGLREIDPDQAAVVVRIFREYVAGISPRAIAIRLNADGIPGPRGGEWRGSSIGGELKRQHGILQNQLYAGVLAYNRTSKIVEPMTRRILIRPNPESEWVTEQVPHLRIIDDALWHDAHRTREKMGGQPAHKAVRPRRMLSGLVFCGQCGSAYSVSKPGRMACGGYRDGGRCTNRRSIAIDMLEKRVIGGLQERMLDPQLVEIYVKEYHETHARQSAEMRRERLRVERRHAEAIGKVERLVTAIADGAGQFVEIRDILAKARSDRDRLADELANMDALPVVALHPTVARDYRAAIAALNESLTANPEASLEAIPRLRSLIDRIELTPSAEKTGVEIEIHGRLAAILALASGQPLDMIGAGMVVDERAKGIEPS